MNIINTAGRATRLDGYAPYGCKALLEVGGKPMIEWQLDVLGEATIVCRPEHAALLRGYGPVAVDGLDLGPASCLSAVPPFDGPVTVVYADTWFDALPEGSDWVGVGTGAPGRAWDVIDPDGKVRYREPSEVATVAVGLYAFADGRRAAAAQRAENAASMAAVLNAYGSWRAVPVPSWRDVGDPDSWARWSRPDKEKADA